MLRLEGMNAFYGKSHILFNVSVAVNEGEVVGLVGRNGVGKTTLLRTIMDQIPNRSGRIEFDGRDLSDVPPHKLARLGLSLVPQEQAVFAEFTVRDNLRVASPNGELDNRLRKSLVEVFPVLDERMNQMAGTLSGGERQMLAMARAFVKNPRLMLLDEPTEGLMPSAVETVERTVRSFGDRGMGILLVEQDLGTVLTICGRVYVMEKGRIIHEETVTEESEASIGRLIGLDD
ncbi:MAG: ABC transporter ATP-binding protein [Nitrospinota bacterium]|jgi:branched-chain amino acid transport system ATP-binding protein|nr:ABC transporter ATP-binding protein [Nitrospinota bacterium]